MTEAQAQGQATPEAEGTQAQPEATEQRSFTQADLNKIAANEKREGRTSFESEILERTGAESIDDVFTAYTEYQGIQEAVTTEADRANSRAERLETRAKTAEERYTNTLREFALRDSLRDRGVPSDRLNDALALAQRDTLEIGKDGSVAGVEEAVEALLEPRPWLLEGEQQRQRVNAPQTAPLITSPGQANGAPDTTQQHANFLANLLSRET